MSITSYAPINHTRIEVSLKWHEYAMAVEIGKLRRLTALRRNSTNNHKASSLGWTEDIEGAAAELVVAKYLGIYWNGSIDSFKSSDLSDCLQIRWSGHPAASLIIRPEDTDEHIYILVTGTIPTMQIHGYMPGSEAKKEKYLRSPNGRPAAYFVPRCDLYPAEDVLTHVAVNT